MKNLYISDELIKGYVYDIKKYMLSELKNYLNADEETNTLIDMIKNVTNVLETIEDLNNKDYVTLCYNSMGAWFINKEV